MYEYARQLLLLDSLRESAIRAAIETLALPGGSSGFDAGCGVGSHTIMLAEAIGETGRMVGGDLSDAMVSSARERIEQAGLSHRVTFERADIASLPFDDVSFDFAWSVDCAGYAPVEPMTVVRELARVVKPGGQVAIMAWSSERLLPGYPELEARLGATAVGIAPFTRRADPTRHFMRASGWLRQAGLRDVTGRSFVGDAGAPLDANTREALASLLQMRWNGAASELEPAERELYERLTDSDSPEYILACPDYQALFTYTMFRGVVGA